MKVELVGAMARAWKLRDSSLDKCPEVLARVWQYLSQLESGRTTPDLPNDQWRYVPITPAAGEPPPWLFALMCRRADDVVQVKDVVVIPETPARTGSVFGLAGLSIALDLDELARAEPAPTDLKGRRPHLRLPTSGQGGVRAGVDLDRSAALLDMMESPDAPD